MHEKPTTSLMVESQPRIATSAASMAAMFLALAGLSFSLTYSGQVSPDVDPAAWIDDAGDQVAPELNGLFGLFGTLIIALFIGQNAGRYGHRPKDSADHRLRQLTFLLALTVGTSTLYLTGLVVLWSLRDEVNVPRLLVIVPAAVVIVGLAMLVGADTRPPLDKELAWARNDAAAERARLDLLRERRTGRIEGALGVLALIAVAGVVVNAWASSLEDFLALSATLIVLEILIVLSLLVAFHAWWTTSETLSRLIFVATAILMTGSLIVFGLAFATSAGAPKVAVTAMAVSCMAAPVGSAAAHLIRMIVGGKLNHRDRDSSPHGASPIPTLAGVGVASAIRSVEKQTQRFDARVRRLEEEAGEAPDPRPGDGN